MLYFCNIFKNEIHILSKVHKSLVFCGDKKHHAIWYHRHRNCWERQYKFRCHLDCQVEVLLRISVLCSWDLFSFCNKKMFFKTSQGVVLVCKLGCKNIWEVMIKIWGKISKKYTYMYFCFWGNLATISPSYF